VPLDTSCTHHQHNQSQKAGIVAAYGHLSNSKVLHLLSVKASARRFATSSSGLESQQSVTANSLSCSSQATELLSGIPGRRTEDPDGRA
jgi:hypothetical protein